MSAPYDWRKEYVICEHVATDAAAGTRHSGFRVCCDGCRDGGFLTTEHLALDEKHPSGYCVAKMCSREGVRS